MNEVNILLAALWASVGVGTLVLGRRVQGVAACGVAVTLSLVAAAAVPFPTPFATALGVIAAPLIAPLVARVMTIHSAPNRLALGGATIAGFGLALVSNPFLDPGCLTECQPRPLALTYDASLAFFLPLLGGAVTVVGLIWLLASVRGDRLLIAVLVVLVPASAATVTRWPLLLTAAATCGLVPVVENVRAVTVARQRVGQLVAALRSAPADPAQTLRDLFGDPSLAIYYRTESSITLVDREGRPEPSTSGSGVTEILARGLLLARVHHDAELTFMDSVQSALSGPAWLSLEIGRLSADVAVRAEQLREARRRIVVRADVERRDLERDVHDGAQQHLLALGMGLRTAQIRCLDGGQAEALLAWCSGQTAAALDDLREVAHGIYPNALASSGLDYALRTLVRRAGIPVTLEINPPIPAGVLSAGVERTAYVVAADAIAQGTGALALRVQISADWLKMQIGHGPRCENQILFDRVAAVGGSLTVENDVWRVVLPCEPSWVKTN